MRYNQPAFPTEKWDGNTDKQIDQEPGMELRDYFAAKAITGALAADMSFNFSAIASEAYDLADAMLEARRKK